MTDIPRERRLLAHQGLRIITREDWRAVQAYTSARTVNEPAEGFFLHISVTQDPDDLAGHEDDSMRVIERIGQQRFGIGYPYNAASFDTGNLYEGQPLTRRGAHTVNDKNTPGFRETGSSGSLNYWYRAICLPQLEADEVTDAQVHSCARWAASQIRSGLARQGAGWAGHRDVAFKACPGERGYRRLPEIRQLTDHYVRVGLRQIPRDQEDEDVIVHFHCEEKTPDGRLVRPPRTVIDGHVHGWTDGFDRDRFITEARKNPARFLEFTLRTAKGFDSFTNSFTQGRDAQAVVDRLQAIEADLADEEPAGT